MVDWGVVAESDFAKQVEAEHCKNHDPKTYEHLTVKKSPTVGQIGHRQEFERQRKFEEAEHHFDRI